MAELRVESNPMATTLNVSAIATVSGPGFTPVTDTLFKDSVALPVEVDVAIGLYDRFFGSPSIVVNADAAKSNQTVEVTAKIGPFNPKFTVPYTLPAAIQTWISDVEVAGYSVDLAFDGSIS